MYPGSLREDRWGLSLLPAEDFHILWLTVRWETAFLKKMDTLVDIDNTCGFAGYSQCTLPLHGGKQILNLCPRQISERLALIEAALADVYVKA